MAEFKKDDLEFVLKAFEKFNFQITGMIAYINALMAQNQIEDETARENFKIINFSVNKNKEGA